MDELKREEKTKAGRQAGPRWSSLQIVSTRPAGAPLNDNGQGGQQMSMFIVCSRKKHAVKIREPCPDEQ